MKVIASSSNLLGKITILILVFLFVNTALALDGSGSQEDPWLIQSLEDFNDFAADANYWDGWTRLETDVNLAGQTYTTAVIAPDTDNSNDSFDGTFFDGSFDGNGKRIFNLTIQGGANDYLGLFGNTSNEVRNLHLEDCNISGDDYVGSLAGENSFSGIIINCYSIGSVSGDDYVGGLVGGNSSTYLIGYCHSSGSVIGHEYVGGLVATNSSSVSYCRSGSYVKGSHYVGGLVGENIGGVYNCSSTGDVNTLGDDIGGLVGINYRNVYYCYSTGDVSGYWSVGGLVGSNPGFLLPEGTITNCYSTGSVSGYQYVGGPVGVNGSEGRLSNIPGYIHNSYSTGTVNGIFYYVGGLVGVHVWGDIEGSFWDTQTSGQPESNGGTGKTTAEMKTVSTFTSAGWDFVGESSNGTEYIWRLCEDLFDYPRLAREFPLGDFLCPDGIDFIDYSFFASHWAQENCGISPDCHGTDLDWRGSVDTKDLAIFVGNWLTGPPPGPAGNPNPFDGALGVSKTADLSWTAGRIAISHDVYFGTSNPPPFIRNLSSTTFNPGTMDYSTTYYWRIDEVNFFGKASGQTWSFTTLSSPPPPPLS